MPVIGIENEAVGFLGGLQGFAQEIRLLDGNQRIFSTMQDQSRSVPRGDLREDADELRILFATGIQDGAEPWRFLIEPIQVIRPGVQDYPLDSLDPIGQQRGEECSTGEAVKVESLRIYPREILDQRNRVQNHI